MAEETTMRKLVAGKTKIGKYRALDENNIGHNYEVFYGNVMKPLVNGEVQHMPLLFIYKNKEYYSRDEVLEAIEKDLGRPVENSEYKELVEIKDTYLELLEEFLNEPENEDYEIPTPNQIKDAIQYCRNLEEAFKRKLNLSKLEDTAQFDEMMDTDLEEEASEVGNGKQDTSNNKDDVDSQPSTVEPEKNERPEDSDISTVDTTTKDNEANEEPAKEEIVEETVSEAVTAPEEKPKEDELKDETSGGAKEDTSINTTVVDIKEADPVSEQTQDEETEDLSKVFMTKGEVAKYIEELKANTTDIEVKGVSKPIVKRSINVKDKSEVDGEVVEKITDLTRTATNLEHSNKRLKLIAILSMLLLIVSLAVNGLFVYRYFDNPYPNGYTQININGTNYKVPIANVEVKEGQKKIMIYGFTTTNENGEITNVAIPLGEFEISSTNEKNIETNE